MTNGFVLFQTDLSGYDNVIIFGVEQMVSVEISDEENNLKPGLACEAHKLGLQGHGASIWTFWGPK